MELEAFGKFLCEQRKTKGMTQEQVGQFLKVTDKAVSRWERGECFPEISQLTKIAELFGISVEELLSCTVKPKHLLKMCEACKNTKCKKNNYSNLEHCSDSFHWVIFGIITAALLVALVAAYLLVNLIGNYWSIWQIPVIMAICYLSTIFILAMIFSLKNIKKEVGARKKDE